jgi:hypothetical protein
LTSSQQPASNEEVADRDVISAGPRPRRPRPRPGGLVWLLVLAETVALAVAVTAAVRYHAQAAGPHSAGPPPAGPPPAGPPPAGPHPAGPSAAGPSAAGLTSALALPQVTTVTLALPADGTVRGTVVITAAVLPGARRGQFTVSAVITGGMPGTLYNLIGYDCSTGSTLPDDIWATGLAGPNGSADLTGYAWTGTMADRYWLVLDPSPVNPPPGLHGQFAEGQAAAYPAAQSPCAAAS